VVISFGTCYLIIAKIYNESNEKMSSPMYFEQPIVIFDTTQALNQTTASFVVYGGMSIAATDQSTDVSSGAFVLAGGIGIGKSLNVGGAANVAGIVTITSTVESVGSGSGALVVNGGLGIAKDLNVAGDATITGNLYVAGTQTIVNSQTIDVADNTLVLNAGPSGSRDSGILIHRSGSDVTSELAVTTGSLTGISQTSFTLGSSFTQDFSGWWIKTTDGLAQIESYDGTTGTLFTSGSTFIPTPTDLTFSLYNKSYLAQYFDESSDEIRFGYIADAADPKVDLENNNNFADVRLKSLTANDTVYCANLVVTSSSSIGNLALAGATLAEATIGNLNITGNSNLHGTVTAGGLFVTGGTTLQLGVTAGGLYVTGASILQGITAGSLNVLSGISAGSIQVTGASILQGVTAGSLNVLSGISAGSIQVTGASILQGVTAGSLNVSGQTILSDATVGSIVVNSGINAGSLNVTGASTLQSLTVTGGSIIFNTVDVSPSMADIVKEQSATVGNNVSSHTNVNLFSFDNAIARSFDAVVSVTINGTSDNSYAYYNLKGIQKDSGSWFLNSSFVGDLTGITFHIDNGQVQYTSLNKPDFDSGLVKFRALTTSV
jgi:hypothetical protein